MKKTSIFLLAILASAFTSVFAKAPGDSTNSQAVRTLIINADVTVVLIDNEKAELEVSGSGKLSRLISFQTKQDTLTINADDFRDLKEEGVVYVPAGSLKKIQVNAEAAVRSFDILQVPSLELNVNSDCNVVLRHSGQLNVTGSGARYAEHTLTKLEWPSSLLRQNKQASN